MAKFQIYQDVPLPPMKRGNFEGREPTYPFHELAVGEFMLVEGVEAKSFGSTVRAAEKRNGAFYTVRSGPIEYQGNVIVPAGSIGVWRIESKPERKPDTRTPEQKAAAVAKAKATREKNQAAKKAA